MNHPIEEIILASGSPRRKELLQRIGIPFRVIKSECEEITTKTEPCEVVMELSQQKAFDVYSKLSETERKDRMVLGADTIVAIHGRILGKPKDEQDAISMLNSSFPFSCSSLFIPNHPIIHCFPYGLIPDKVLPPEALLHCCILHGFP